MEKELNYIYSYIKYIYFNVDELKDEKYLLSLSRKIKNSMPNSSFSDGNLNFYINNYVDQEMRFRNSNSYARHQSLKNYIYLSIDYYRIFYGRRIQNQDVVICEVMKGILGNHSYEEILEGNCESEIEKLIEMQPDVKYEPKEKITRVPLDITHITFNGNSVIDDRTYISKYIFDYLNGIKDLFEFKGDIKILANLICSDMCKERMHIDDILSGEYDTVIDSYIRKKMFGIQFTNKFGDVYIEVSRFVMTNHTYMDVGNLEQNVAEEIFELSKHLIRSGYDRNSIKNGQCDNIMENHLRLNCLKANSRVCKNTKLAGKDKNPNKFFLDFKFESLKKPIAVALALGIISTSVAFGEFNNNSSNNENIESFDTYEYPDIPYTMSEEFAETLEHVVEYYDMYESYDRGYGQICLYRSYESIKGSEKDKTYAMDIMFALIKSRAQYIDEMQNLYNDVKPYQSYMEYVYDRMVMINPKFKEDIYSKAVRSYASQVANYKELNPFSLLNADEQKALKEMMKSYGKYIDNLEIGFNKLINNTEREK